MDPERWKEIERLCQSTLEMEPLKREAYLKEACAGDESLRKEVEALLEQQTKAEGFLKDPAIEDAAKALAKEHEHVLARDLIGRTISHYRIVEKIGQGGMGEVFLADDTSLHRKVALKFLSLDLQQDPAAHNRFLREARSAAALDNPHICSIHEVGQFEGKDFIVMEYVAGKTLDDLIPRKGMRLSLALNYAVQIAEAVSRAHDAGIIHRDLKPSNVMVDEHGLVKVLDFGLAKLTDTSGPEAQTISTGTGEGTILGTAAYMSPEQAEGKKVDPRSDIFSFGSVLYEMLTGQRAFRGDTRASTIASILREEPQPVSQVAEGLPREVERIVKRCLRKDTKHRFQHMDDLKVALEELKEESNSQPVAEAQTAIRQKRSGWLWAASIGVALLAAGTWLWRTRTASELPPPRVVTLTSYAGSEGSPTFSPDGNQVAFAWYKAEVGHADIYVKVVGETDALRLTKDPDGSFSPAWSPDGRSIAFLREGETDKTGIYLMSPLGGSERRISNDPFGGTLSWTPDGKFLAAVRPHPATPQAEDPSGIYLIPVAGGPERRITSPKAPVTDDSPSVSPDGKLLAFARCSGNFRCDIYCRPLGPDGSPQGEPRRITRQNFGINCISWSRNGASVIYSASALWGMKFYLWRASVNSDSPPLRLEFAGPYALSPAVAPSKDRLAYTSGKMQDIDIWRFRLGGAPEPLISSSLVDSDPDFSPDGKKIAFASDRGGETYDIWVSDANGSNAVQLTHEDGAAGTPHWSPDGRLIVFDLFAPDGSVALYTISATGGHPTRLTPGPTEAVMGCWSPDGKWIYFGSNRSGIYQIWRMPATGGEAQQITQHGADRPLLSVDGEILYFNKGSEIFAIPSAGGEERKIVDSVSFGSFTVTRHGIYCIREKDGRNELCSLDPLTLKSRMLTVVEGNIFEGLTASPDGKTVLFTRSKVSGSDLMLVENFR